MCEFCTQHGEGKKWYLTMENYSVELLDQMNRRRYAAEFLNGFHTRVPHSIQMLDKIRKTPLIGLSRPTLTRYQRRLHRLSAVHAPLPVSSDPVFIEEQKSSHRPHGLLWLRRVPVHVPEKGDLAASVPEAAQLW